MFADSAQVRLTSFAPPEISFEEIWLLDPPSNNFPTVHFRHSDSANVAFMDGSVRSYSFATHLDVPGSNFIQPIQADRMHEERLGFVSDGTLSDPMTRDALYDRE